MFEGEKVLAGEGERIWGVDNREFGVAGLRYDKRDRSLFISIDRND